MGLGAMVGGIALEQAIPLGRVWSFPKRIAILPSISTLQAAEITTLPPDIQRLAQIYYDRAAIEQFNNSINGSLF